MTPRLRIINNDDGSLACEHRSLSVCPDCWNATPDLVNVYETVFWWYGGDGWSQDEVESIAAGRTPNVTLSPGTKTKGTMQL